MKSKPILANWVNQNPCKSFGTLATVFVAMSVVHLTLDENSLVATELSANSCRVDAYVGAGHYIALVEDTHEQLYRIGDTRNAIDPEAKREAQSIAQRVCTGAQVTVALQHNAIDPRPKIVAVF